MWLLQNCTPVSTCKPMPMTHYSLLCCAVLCCTALCCDCVHPDCLYDIDIPSDVEYIHVQLVAKELPPLEFVREVGRAASGFWAAHPDQYIAIHCAYGET